MIMQEGAAAQPSVLPQRSGSGSGTKNFTMASTPGLPGRENSMLCGGTSCTLLAANQCDQKSWLDFLYQKVQKGVVHPAHQPARWLGAGMDTGIRNSPGLVSGTEHSFTPPQLLLFTLLLLLVNFYETDPGLWQPWPRRGQ